MNLKSAILGTQHTGDDARDVLRQAGIVGFQRMSGYEPANCSEPLPETLDAISRRSAKEFWHPYEHFQAVIARWASQYGDFPQKLMQVNSPAYDFVKDRAHDGRE